MSDTITTTQDCELLADIHASSFPDSWTALFFGALLAQPGVVALATGGAPPQGFILIRAAADESEILTLAVRPNARNRGLGKQLVNAAMDALATQKIARCFLEVAEDNAPAITIYSRAGFTTCGRRNDYYRHDGTSTAAIVMERRFDSPKAV